uniref:Cytochrome c oxidase subunit 4 n=1 Tax=Arion vulgaris TaxID=1028688 RepID=A0A0B7ANT1_9EUPU
MSSHLFRLALRATKVPQRTISSSSVCKANIVLDQALRDEIHPKIGNREIVGYGSNGLATYIDSCEFPCPAIRFKEPTAEVIKLQEKEKGDWKNLSLADKKELYRISFCQTYSEMHAPTGEWKVIVAAVLLTLSATGWLWMYVKQFVYSPPVSTITVEWQNKTLQRMLDQNQGAISGVASKWDYTKQRWKE